MANFFEILKGAKVPPSLWPEQPRSPQLRTLEAEAHRFPAERLAALYSIVPTPDDVQDLAAFTAITEALAAYLEATPAPTVADASRGLGQAFADAENSAGFTGTRDARDEFALRAIFCALMTLWDLGSISRSIPPTAERELAFWAKAEKIMREATNGS